VNVLAPFLVFCGLLWAALTADVIWFMPTGGNGPAREMQFISRCQTKNFVVAEEMVSTLLASPPAGWSREVRCVELGHGVWYARGVVGLESAAGGTPTPWQALFLPETVRPLYLVVGAKKQGDLVAALRQAGIDRLP
jgi:hypothetical protein